MAKLKGRKKHDDDGLWLANVEFNGRADKNFVRTELITISEKIAHLRKTRQLSQEALAELTCVSVATIKFIEQKQRVPSLAVLLKIIYALDGKSQIWP